MTATLSSPGPDAATASMPTPGGEFVQLLKPDGVRIEHPTFSWEGDDATIAAHLRMMVLSRRLDSEATALQRKGQLGLWPPMLGQEAAQVGSAAAVRGHDEVIPSYREHGVALCLGIDPLDLLKTFRGTAMVDWDSRGHHFHLYSFVIGTQSLHAVGYAMGIQRDGTDRAVITYFGDGATSQGDVNESFVFASVYNAPVVFFCQNNQWAISEPLERQTRIPLYKRALGFGFPGVRVDGNDVLAVLAVTRAALQNAREGNGPTLIEAFTYRMGAHTTSDDPTRYRVAADLEEWKLKDPIERVKVYLARNGIADHGFFDAVEAESEALAVRLREGCRSMPNPAPESLFDHVYAEQHPLIDSERQEFVRYHASFAGGEH